MVKIESYSLFSSIFILSSIITIRYVTMENYIFSYKFLHLLNIQKQSNSK